MSETRILIRLLQTYISRNWEFGTAFLKLRNFGGGGVVVNPPPLGTPVAYKAPTTPWRWQPFAETCRGRIWNALIKIHYFLEHLLVILQRNQYHAVHNVGGTANSRCCELSSVYGGPSWCSSIPTARFDVGACVYKSIWNVSSVLLIVALTRINFDVRKLCCLQQFISEKHRRMFT
jgi:hypothetical protein